MDAQEITSSIYVAWWILGNISTRFIMDSTVDRSTQSSMVDTFDLPQGPENSWAEFSQLIQSEQSN